VAACYGNDTGGAACPSIFMTSKTACLFIDGENLRHSLVELFHSEFQAADYLPKGANWGGFFDHIVRISGAESRLRAYWYVVEEIEFFPFGPWTKDPIIMDQILCKHIPFRDDLSKITNASARANRARFLSGTIMAEERKMRRRFDGWKEFQNGISNRFDAIEFRRAGSIRYDLFRKQFGKEKAVDVYLATDLLQLRNIYDVAIIVSGDQDYVPAVQAVKDSGKHVINVSFLERGGRLLPGGARRLNMATDRTIEMEYSEAIKFMRFPPSKTTGSLFSPSNPAKV
jgi:uncharacterized LabA/DUF88 family protein